MLIFHGTRMDDPWRGLPEGLQPIKTEDILERAKRVLAAEGETLDSVPEWVWMGEVRHRQEEFRRTGPFVHFTSSFDQAVQYSGMGGEFDYCIRYRLFGYRHGNELLCEQQEFAAGKNGRYRVVVAIDVLEDLVYDQAPDPEKLRRVLKEKGKTLRDIGGLQVPIREVRPEQIVGLVVV